MRLLQRKAFMKMGLAAAGGIVAAGCGMGSGSGDDDGMIIHVHGTLSSDPPGAAPDNQIDATVTGMGTDLSGSGRSYFEVGDIATVVASASMWSIRGSRVKDLIRLKGVTILANTPEILGAPVTVEVDVKTGAVSWAMGPFLTGPYRGLTAASKAQLTVAIRDVDIRRAAPAANKGNSTPSSGSGGM